MTLKYFESENYLLFCLITQHHMHTYLQTDMKKKTFHFYGKYVFLQI